MAAWTRPDGRSAFATAPLRRTDFARRSPRWCGRGDSNPYDLAIASPSSWCVCQFRHFRLGQFDVSNLTTLDNRLPSSETLVEVYGRRGTPTTKDGNAGDALRREAQARTP